MEPTEIWRAFILFLVSIFRSGNMANSFPPKNPPAIDTSPDKQHAGIFYIISIFSTHDVELYNIHIKDNIKDKPFLYFTI